ncbi:MAG: M28 family peptidase, partial [bacterium]|nr:M28 family peptidase [bacterium]
MTIMLIILLSLLTVVAGYTGEMRENETVWEKPLKASRLYEMVEHLASPEFEGRLTGSQGYAKAANMATAIFKTSGLKPAFENYKQTFNVPVTNVSESSLVFHFKNKLGKEETHRCSYFDDFYPLLFSGDGAVNSSVIFAGYGVTAPEYGVDDYKDLDVKGKIVMIIKGVPDAGKNEDWSHYNSHRYLTGNAYKHGAAGLLYIVDDTYATVFGDHLVNFPMVQVAKKTADKLLAPYGWDVAALRKKLNKKENVSFAMESRAHLSVSAEARESMGINVAGYIPGSDPVLKDEFIILCAHLDHCGHQPVLTPGAGDNASGSAVIMALARALAAYPGKFKRSILFVLFDAEEMGILGARHFVSRLPEPVKRIRFVLNLDQV